MRTLALFLSFSTVISLEMTGEMESEAIKLKYIDVEASWKIVESMPVIEKMT